MSNVFNVVDRTLAFRILDGRTDLRLHPDTYESLVNFYSDQMPQDILRGRSGDIHEWILDALERDTILHSFDVT